MRTTSFIQTNNQRTIIVYNIPHHRAVDFIEARRVVVMGDSGIAHESFSGNFYMQPTRTLYRVGSKTSIPGLLFFENFSSFAGKHIICIDSNTYFEHSSHRPLVDLLLISKNPRLSITQLSSSLDIKQIVFDGSVTTRRMIRWEEECDSLKIPFHVGNEKGAFVMKL